MNQIKFIALMVGYGILCFITAFILSSNKSRVSEHYPSAGGLYGPLQIEEKNSVYSIAVYQSVPEFRWSFVEIELLDANQEYLMGFGDELWKESGYDAEGAWTESKYDYEMKITFPEAGTYYLRISSQTNSPNVSGIQLTLKEKRGSSVAFYWMGLISWALACLAVFFYPRRPDYTDLDERRKQWRQLDLDD